MPDHLLAGKRVLLGVTGGIAAYKAADLCSKLVQAGAEVDVILTDAAARFVAPLTFAALSNRPARVDMWTSPGGEPIPHVRMAAAADLVIVAPLSANTLAKLALGLADNLLTATLLATPIRDDGRTTNDDEGRTTNVRDEGPTPEMGRRAVGAGAGDGVAHVGQPADPGARGGAAGAGAILVGPGVGRLASGASGAGRMAEPAEILAAARLALARGGPLAGRRVVITAGGTQEPLDPVRFLTNASSGKMGVALAEAARDLGAGVTLIHAPLAVALPPGVECIPVRTAVEMCDAVLALPAADRRAHRRGGGGRFPAGGSRGAEDQEGAGAGGSDHPPGAQPGHPGRGRIPPGRDRAAPASRSALPPRRRICWRTPRPSWPASNST